MLPALHILAVLEVCWYEEQLLGFHVRGQTDFGERLSWLEVQPDRQLLCQWVQHCNCPIVAFYALGVAPYCCDQPSPDCLSVEWQSVAHRSRCQVTTSQELGVCHWSEDCSHLQLRHKRPLQCFRKQKRKRLQYFRVRQERDCKLAQSWTKHERGNAGRSQ